MEKVPGVQISKEWDGMGQQKRISLIKRLTQRECELSEIQFPAYGSLFYRSSLDCIEMIPLDSSIDPKGEFCIGPSCDCSGPFNLAKLFQVSTVALGGHFTI